MTRLTNEQRAALRRAVNAHPDKEKYAPGVHVSSLSKDALLGLAYKLGVLVSDIVANAATPAEIPEDDMPEENAPAPVDAIDQAVEDELGRIRGMLATGGFAQLDGVLRDLVREARKPAEIIYQSTAGANVPKISCAKPVQTATWGKTFGVRGANASRTVQIWDAQDAPAIDTDYVWPASTSAVLSQMARKRHVWLHGPKGTGKSAFAKQIAARLHRPFSVISCDGGIEAIELIGQNLPDGNGGTFWQDGQLLQAIQRPGCVILIDEPSGARPSALFVFHHLLQDREIFIRETGRRVVCAPGVLFLAADNTNGTGNGNRHGYSDTNRVNAATLDRFSIMVPVDYLSPAKEAKVLVARTGCTPALADILVKAAGLTRAVAASGNIVQPIGLRQMFGWAELLTDGIDPVDALNMAVLAKAPEQDVETLRQQCLLAVDRAEIAAALNNTPAVAPAPVTPGEFSPVIDDEGN